MEVTKLYLRIGMLLMVMFVLTNLNVFIWTTGITSKDVSDYEIDEYHEDIQIPMSTIMVKTNDNKPEVSDELVAVPVTTPMAGFDTELLLKAPIETMSLLTVKDDPISKFSEQDIKWLARVTMSEASTQSFEVQVAVAQTVINRLHSGLFGSTINEIVHAKNQYSTADNGDPTDQIFEAVREAITNPIHPNDMFYFRTKCYHKGRDKYKKLGVFYFSKQSW